MRGLGLLRAARQAAEAPAALGWAPPACPASWAPAAAAAQLTSLLGFQRQQVAGYAKHRGDEEDEEEELAAAAAAHHPHRHSKLSHSERRLLIQRKLDTAAAAEEEDLAVAEAELQAVEEELMEGLKARTPVSYARRHQIRKLLDSLGRGAADDSVTAFVTKWVQGFLAGAQGAAGGCSGTGRGKACAAVATACILLDVPCTTRFPRASLVPTGVDMSSPPPPSVYPPAHSAASLASARQQIMRGLQQRRAWA